MGKSTISMATFHSFVGFSPRCTWWKFLPAPHFREPVWLRGDQWWSCSEGACHRWFQRMWIICVPKECWQVGWLAKHIFFWMIGINLPNWDIQPKIICTWQNHPLCNWICGFNVWMIGIKTSCRVAKQHTFAWSCGAGERCSARWCLWPNFIDLGEGSSQLVGWWLDFANVVPSGKHTKNYGKTPFLMGKLTIKMAIFNSYVKLPEGRTCQKNTIVTIPSNNP